MLPSAVRGGGADPYMLPLPVLPSRPSLPLPEDIIPVLENTNCRVGVAGGTVYCMYSMYSVGQVLCTLLQNRSRTDLQLDFP